MRPFITWAAFARRAAAMKFAWMGLIEFSTFGKRFHSRQPPHISHKVRQQRGNIVFPPEQSKRQRQTQIRYRQQDHAFGTSPARGSADKSHAQPARHEAKNS